jgi:hypothetical protein
VSHRPLTFALALLVALALGAGCAGKPVDPLAADRAQLLALDDEPPPEGWPSDATVFIGHELIRAQLQAAFDDARGEAAKQPAFTTPLGDIRMVPTARVRGVRLAPSDACAECVTVSTLVEGELQIGVTGPVGEASYDAQYTAAASSAWRLALVSEEGRQRVSLRAVTGEEWKVDVKLSGLPGPLNAVFSGGLTEQVRGLVDEGLLHTIPIADLPDDELVHIRGLRARTVLTKPGTAHYVVAVEVSFVALRRGDVGAPPDPGEGFSVVIPEPTLLGLVQAATLRAEPADGHVAEPLSLDVDGDRFELLLRIWEIAPKPKSRDFRIGGRFILEDGEVRVSADEAREEGAGFTLDPLALLIRAATLDALQKGLSMVVPAREEHGLLLGRRVAVEVQSVRGEADALRIDGRVRLIVPEAESAPADEADAPAR